MPKRHVRRRRRRAPSEFSANVAYLHFAIVATLELQSGRYPPLLTFSVSPLRGKKFIAICGRRRIERERVGQTVGESSILSAKKPTDSTLSFMPDVRRRGVLVE